MRTRVGGRASYFPVDITDENGGERMTIVVSDFQYVAGSHVQDIGEQKNSESVGFVERFGLYLFRQFAGHGELFRVVSVSLEQL